MLKISRRRFIQSTVFAGLAGSFGLGLDKVFAQVINPPRFDKATFAYGSQSPEATINAKTGEVSLNPDILIRHSVCLGCYTGCGNRVKIDKASGKIMRAFGNPYHPISAEPHLQYDTPVKTSYLAFSPDHSLGVSHGTLCARGNSTIQGVYDPYRILMPLKRAGKRGSGKWRPISFDQLVTETVEGGQVFAEIGEEHIVEGLRAIRDTKTPLDSSQPELGPKANLLAWFGGRNDGRTQFGQRFVLKSFGSINYFGHTGTCGGTRRYAYCTFLGDWQKNPHMKPDYRSAKYVLTMGTAPGQAGNPMQLMARQSANGVADGRLKMTVVDPLLGGGVSKSKGQESGWLGIKPGTDGAFVMALIQEILRTERFNATYLSCTTSDAAKMKGFASHTNGAYLVITDPKHRHYRKILRGQDLGLEHDEMMVLTTDHEPVSYKTGQGELFFKGTLTTNQGISVEVATALSLLKERADQYTLAEYSEICGIAVEKIQQVAQEFTSYGTEAGTDHHGGFMAPSAFYGSYGLIVLNALIGSVNMKGGMTMSGGAYKSFAPGPRYDVTEFPGMVKPQGIKISREKTPYEKTPEYRMKKSRGENPYPATLPWYPLSFEGDSQALVSMVAGYPYRPKAVMFWMQNPLYTVPGAYQAETIAVLKDPSKIPLMISCDVVMSETTSLCDYIIPDTHFYESWGAPAMWGAVTTKFTASRWPVVEPLTPQTPYGFMSIEAYILAVADQMKLPGYGEKAIPDVKGHIHSMKQREDYYLKVLANVAFDGKPVPDVTAEEVEIMDLNQVLEPYKDSLTEEEWRKVAYVLARGGRFEHYDQAYVNNHLKYAYPGILQIYSEVLATTRNSQTGYYYEGLPYYLPPVFADGSLIEETLSEQEWPFRLVSQKAKYRSTSMLVNSPVLTGIQEENPIDMNQEDAKRLGLRSGDRVKIVTPLKEAQGILRVRQGISLGTLGIQHSFGHWEYGSSSYEIAGKKEGGDTKRSGGIAYNPLGVQDQSIERFYPLADFVAGGAARNAVRAKVVKV